MRALRAFLLVPILAACTTPLELGERRYREGDRLAALEVWRSVPSSSPYYDAARRRAAAVEDEFHQLVVRYKKRARYYETKGRLAESVLNYRLALELQPDDVETLDHAQVLSRTLAERKRELETSYRAALEQGRLAEARGQIDLLRQADPFDPELETEERQIDEALQGEIQRLLARGRRGFTSGDHTRAESAFREVLALDPENETALGHLSYIATIRSEEAPERERIAGEPREIHATDAEIRAEGFYQNALVAEGRAEPYAAIEHDLEALRADPNHAGARSHLDRLRRRLVPEVDRLIEGGRHHFREEELEAALEEWRRALLIDPDNARAREYVTRAERMLENLEQLRSEPDGARRSWTP